MTDPWADADTVLALRTCGPDGSSHNGYRYDLTVGAVCTAPDWDPTPKCGGGLHVLVEADGDWGLLDWEPGARALIVRVRRDELVAIDSAKSKVPRLRIEEITTLPRALCKLACDPATINRVVEETVRRAKEGNFATSGYASNLAASGDASRLAASGYASRLAASGAASRLAASGDHSRLAASGDYSRLAASGDHSRLAASGYASLVLASYGAVAQAGECGCIALAWWDGKRPRVSVGYVGEGLQPHKWYRLDAHGNFIEDEAGR